MPYIQLEERNIRSVRGDTVTLRLELVNEYNEPSDTTNCTGIFTLKDNLNDTDANAKFRKYFYAHPLQNISGGIRYFKIDTQDTNNLEAKKYYYDIEIRKPIPPSGAGIDKFTLQKGDFYLEADTTRT